MTVVSKNTASTPLSKKFLLDLRERRLDAGRLAVEARRRFFGNTIATRETDAPPPVGRARRWRDTQSQELQKWPTTDSWQTGDRMILRVEAADASEWATYLIDLAAVFAESCNAQRVTQHSVAPFSIAPFSSSQAATHDMWAIATARLTLPSIIRVEARHDLLGIHLAQVSLQFGADTLAGPPRDSRHLPLAGVTRPNETSAEAICALIRHAGFEADHPDKSSNTPEDSSNPRNPPPLS